MPTPGTQILELNADEIMCLSDRILNHDVGSEQHPVNAYLLLLKVGSAFTELLDGAQKKPGTVPLAVTEAEAWILRSKILTGDKTASDGLFGIRLLTKIYGALLGFHREDGVGHILTIHDIFTGKPPEVSSETPDPGMTNDQKKALSEWQAKNKPADPEVAS